MRAKDVDRATAEAEKAELYYIAHPTSPSAVRRPKLSVRSGTWIALLGQSVQDGICGFGATIEGGYALLTLNIWQRCARRMGS